MIKSISSVFQEAWEFTRKNIALLAFGALLCGVASGIIQWQYALHVQNAMGFDQVKMEQLAARAREGDEAAQEEMMAEFFGGSIPTTEEEARQRMAEKMVSTFYAIVPVLAVSFLATVLLLNFAAAYFWMSALRPSVGIGGTCTKAIVVLPKMIGLSLWAFLRSFAWVPVIGVGFAIYFFPRLVQAPIHLLEKKKGILASVRLSFNNTKGMWWNIFKVEFVVWLACFIASFLITSVANSVLPIPLVSGILTYCIVAFTAVCMSILGKSTMKA